MRELWGGSSEGEGLHDFAVLGASDACHNWLLFCVLRTGDFVNIRGALNRVLRKPCAKNLEQEKSSTH